MKNYFKNLLVMTLISVFMFSSVETVLASTYQEDGLPDLVIKNIKFHKEWHTMENIITYEIWNIGNADVNIEEPRALATNTTINGLSNVCSTKGDIPVNSHKECFNILKSSSDYFNINHSGYYEVKVTADREPTFPQNDNLVTESNENNNSLTKRIYIDLNHESYKPAPIEILSIPKTVHANKSFEVTISGDLASPQYEVADVEVDYNAYSNCMAIGHCPDNNTIVLKPKVRKKTDNRFYTQVTVPYKKKVKIKGLNKGTYKMEVIGSNKTIDEKFEAISTNIPIPDMPSPIKKVTIKGILKKDPSSSTGISLINLNGRKLAYLSLEECTSNLDIYTTCGNIDFADYADKGIKVNGYVKRMINILPVEEMEEIQDEKQITISRPGKNIKRFIKNSYRKVRKVYVEDINLIQANESFEITVEDEVALDITPYNDVKNNWAVDHIKFLKNNNIISQTNEDFNPENNITVSEASKIVAGVVDAVNSTDLDNDKNWQSTVMDILKKEGIIDPNEFSTSEFSRPIRRKEFVKMIIKALGIDVKESTTSSFSDVKNDSYKKYIEKASELKIVNGYGNGTFGPDNFIKRSELAKVIHNTLLSI